jgi:hypothetical protein
MPTQVQFRRGTTAQNAGFTGANGEISIDISKKTIIVHDGSTPGGFPLAPNTAYDKANDAYSLANAAYVYANTIIGESTNLIPVFTQANAAYNLANGAYVYANTINVIPAFTKANDAYDLANGAYVYANTINLVPYALSSDLANVNTFAYGVSTNTTASFNKANTALQNTNVTLNGTFTVSNTIVVNTLKGPYTDDTDASSNGNVALKEFYYDSTGTVKIRLV